MVYVREKIIVDLHFDEYFPGLNVATVEPSGAVWEEVIIPRMDKEGAIDPLQWIDIFVACLDSWDLKYPDGQSVPCTRKGLMSHDLDFVKIIVKVWLNTALTVRRDEYGNLLSSKDSDARTVAEKDMEVEVINDDPLRHDVALTVDLPNDFVVPDEEPTGAD